MSAPTESTTGVPGIPLPIVALNRWMLVVGIGVAFVFQLPWITTIILVILLGSIVFGPRGSLVFQVGNRLLAGPVAKAKAGGHVEDRRLMRFNNSIAVILLAIAQVAFLAGTGVVGWVLSLMVVVAAAVALAGFC
ncbi:MAG TPA: DUF4395 family protein, partial [Thermomicrobiales bacterium]|nr:DUF4395 family protein [Thermomicrobiales bacterium]